MTLRDLRAAVAKLDGLHPLTPVNVGDVQDVFGKVFVEVDSPLFERMEDAVREAEAAQRCAEIQVGDLESQVDQLEDENRKLRAVIGSSASK
jgi:hypothetical protein